MLSPWTVYWVLQLDLIRGTQEFLFIVLLFYTAGVCFTAVLASCDNEPGKAKNLFRHARNIIPVAVVWCVFMTLTPNTKTMCAVLTIPAVANNEMLQRDATKIYELGMERLKEVLEIESVVNEDENN